MKPLFPPIPIFPINPPNANNMKSWYPRDYTQALSNTPTEEKLTNSLQKPGRSPRFVYGMLMLPTVLKYYTDVHQRDEIWRSMTQATLFGYKLYQFADGSPPVIAPSSDPQAAVDGMLIFDLNETQRNAIYELESGLLELVNVQVEICMKDCQNVRSLRCVDAGAFAWLDSTKGLQDMGSSAWEVDEFLNSCFYENIALSQRSSALQMLRSDEPVEVCRPTCTLSLEERERKKSKSLLIQRYQASLGSVYEDHERPD